MKIMRRVRAVCAALMALCLIAAPLCARADLTARFIDVGQGDSCLITCDGESMIVDGGTADNSSKLVALMKALDVDELKYMVNTHPHDDHVGGLCGPLNKVRVDAAYSSTLDYDQNYFISYKRYAQKQGVSLGTLSAGDTLKLGGADVYVLAPIVDTADISDLNDTSIILRVVYGRTSMLLTGDAGLGEERALIDSGAEAANLASTQFNPNDGPGGTRYYVSDDPAGFDRLAGLFLQEDVETNAGLVDISRF